MAALHQKSAWNETAHLDIILVKVVPVKEKVLLGISFIFIKYMDFLFHGC